jgi:hypothetical protein
MRSSTKRVPKRNGEPPVAAPASGRKVAPKPAVTAPSTPPAAAPENNRFYASRPATGKERVLAQWRRVDLRAAEIAFRSTERPAGSVVGGVLKKLRLDQRQAETEIVKVWNNLIDASLTAHAQPAGIHKGTLFVNVDSSVWLDEIVRYRRKDILTRLQTAFGRELIQRISFRVG